MIFTSQLGRLEFAGKWMFSAMSAQYEKLLGGQQFFPFLFGFDDFIHRFYSFIQFIYLGLIFDEG